MSRKEEMLKAGVQLANRHGINNVTRRMVANEVGVSGPLVAVYLGNVPDMRKAIAKAAKSMGVVMPDKKTEQAIGLRLRSEARRRATA